MNGILFVTDPLAGLHAEIDATIGLMHASQELGLDVWSCAPEELAIVDVAGFEVAHLRIDPPVDDRYLHTTYLLDLAGTRVVNRPDGIRAVHEKLVALRFPELCPPTYVGTSIGELRSFVARVGTAVVKPVDGFAGLDVWLVHDDQSAVTLLESATRGGRRQVIAQQYLPAVAYGNKRLFLLDGENRRRGAAATVRRRLPDRTAGCTGRDRRRRSRDRRRAPAAAGPARSGHRQRRRHRQPADRGQRDLPRRHAQDRRTYIVGIAIGVTAIATI